MKSDNLQQNRTTRFKIGLAAIGGLAAFFFLLNRIHPFLAASHPVKADILLVEGWIPTFAFQEAVNEFHRGGYRTIVTIGGPIGGVDGFEKNNESYATMAKNKIIQLGLKENEVLAAPAEPSNHHHTLHAILGFKKWLADSGTNVQAVNILTIGPHAGKSHVLLKRTLGAQFPTGVISVKHRIYDPDRWWMSRRGIRWTAYFAIGYVYALFWPLGMT